MARPWLAVALAAVATVARADDAEEAFRARVRAELLADSMPDPIQGVQVRIALDNRVDRAFRLVSASLALDGQVLWQRASEAIEPRRIEVFDGSIVDGDHSLAAALTYRGRAFGVFTYLEGYRLRVSGSCSFSLATGPPVRMRVLVTERGSVWAPSGDPPAVHCQFARRR